MRDIDITELTARIIETTIKELIDLENDDLMQDLLLESQEAY